VTWISSLDACQEAISQGVDLLITHEPTFWDHWDVLPRPEDSLTAVKQEVIDSAGLVVLRLHDSWDLFPEVGITYAWARFLGMDGKPVDAGASPYQHRHDIAPRTAGTLAREIAARTATLGEPMVQLFGDPEQLVSRVGIGTGCGCDPKTFAEMGCDIAVTCDDGISCWREAQRSLDAGFPIIRVHHGTSEEPGMLTLTAYLQETFPSVSFRHLPHRCMFTLIG
jgi:putative NIF3 family GTP cyclohydrolase 1 type 2